MKSVIDPVFGEMIFDEIWEKTEKLVIWSQTFLIKILAADIDELGITQLQRDAYSLNKCNFSSLIDVNSGILQNYCDEWFGETANKVENLLIPSYILFKPNGTWGIVFDSSKDPENGVVLCFKDTEVYVCDEDDFL